MAAVADRGVAADVAVRTDFAVASDDHISLDIDAGQNHTALPERNESIQRRAGAHRSADVVAGHRADQLLVQRQQIPGVAQTAGGGVRRQFGRRARRARTRHPEHDDAVGGIANHALPRRRFHHRDKFGRRQKIRPRRDVPLLRQRGKTTRDQIAHRNPGNLDRTDFSGNRPEAGHFHGNNFDTHDSILLISFGTGRPRRRSGPRTRSGRIQLLSSFSAAAQSRSSQTPTSAGFSASTRIRILFSVPE